MEKPTNYYTENQVDITTRVNEKRTHFILGLSNESKEKAESHARKTISYVEDVYSFIKDKGFKQIGYGVPK